MMWAPSRKRNPARAVTLVIVYNHYFPQNISRLEKMYSKRFTSLVHVMPFATKKDQSRANVIPVFESSHYFSGYVAQASHQLPDSQLYLFVADDAVLNPLVDENNFADLLGLDSGNFLPRLRGLGAGEKFWAWATAASEWSAKFRGVEVTSLLPSKEEAVSSFERHGLKNYLEVPSSVLESTPSDQYTISLDFPLARGWSDIFVIRRESLATFSRLCGIFAATNLFVEVAIPTAMVLSSKKIHTSASSRFKPRAVWTTEEKKRLEAPRGVNELFESLPPDTFCIHPVKVSRWDG